MDVKVGLERSFRWNGLITSCERWYREKTLFTEGTTSAMLVKIKIMSCKKITWQALRFRFSATTSPVRLLKRSYGWLVFRGTLSTHYTRCSQHVVWCLVFYQSAGGWTLTAFWRCFQRFAAESTNRQIGFCCLLSANTACPSKTIVGLHLLENKHVQYYLLPRWSSSENALGITQHSINFPAIRTFKK